MVCVPCIFIPVLLFLWHKFVQPYVLRFWNPWEKKDEKGKVVETEFPFSCKGGVCPFPNKSAKVADSNLQQDPKYPDITEAQKDKAD